MQRPALQGFSAAGRGNPTCAGRGVSGPDGPAIGCGRTVSMAAPMARWQSPRLPHHADYELSRTGAGAAGSAGVSSR